MFANSPNLVQLGPEADVGGREDGALLVGPRALAGGAGRLQPADVMLQ